MLLPGPPECKSETGSTDRRDRRVPVQPGTAQRGLVVDTRALAAVWRALDQEVRVLLVSGGRGRTRPGAPRDPDRIGDHRGFDPRPRAHASNEPPCGAHAGGMHRLLSVDPLRGASGAALPLSDSLGQFYVNR